MTFPQSTTSHSSPARRTVEVRFSLHSEKTRLIEGAVEGHARISTKIAFFGDAFKEGVTCGKSPDRLQRLPFDELPVGIKNAALVDAAGSRASAINFGNESNSDFEKNLRSELVMLQEITLLTNPGSVPSNWSEWGPDWHVTCWIAESSAFRTIGSSAGMESFMPPQVNLTSQESRTDYQNSLAVLISVPREPGVKLVEGYPEPNVSDVYWDRNLTVHWMNATSQEYNIGWTEQPVWIFSQRTTSDERAVKLTLFGVFLGVVGTAVLQALHEWLNLWLARRPGAT